MYTIHSRPTDQRSEAEIWMGNGFKGSKIERELNRQSFAEKVASIKKPAKPVFGKRVA